jgi:hypothetical protein
MPARSGRQRAKQQGMALEEIKQRLLDESAPPSSTD